MAVEAFRNLRQETIAGIEQEKEAILAERDLLNAQLTDVSHYLPNMSFTSSTGNTITEVNTPVIVQKQLREKQKIEKQLEENSKQLEEISDKFEEICDLFGHDADIVGVEFHCKCCGKWMGYNKYQYDHFHAKFGGGIVPFHYEDDNPILI